MMHNEEIISTTASESLEEGQQTNHPQRPTTKFWKTQRKLIALSGVLLILIVIIVVPTVLLTQKDKFLNNNNNNNNGDDDDEQVVSYTQLPFSHISTQIKCFETLSIIGEIDPTVRYEVPSCRATSTIDHTDTTVSHGSWFSYVGTGSCLDLHICTAQIRIFVANRFQSSSFGTQTQNNDSNECWIGMIPDIASMDNNGDCTEIHFETEYDWTYLIYVDFPSTVENSSDGHDHGLDHFGFKFDLACPDCEPTSIGTVSPSPTVLTIPSWKDITPPLYGSNPGDYTGGSIDDNLSNSALDLSYNGNIMVYAAENANGNGGENSGIVKLVQLRPIQHMTSKNNENVEYQWIPFGISLEGNFPNHHFGTSVSLNSDGSVVAIGSPQFQTTNDDGVLMTNVGHVRIMQFDVTDEDVIYIRKLGSEDIVGEEMGEEMGFDVSLNSDGSILAIGSRSYQEKTGRVRVFQFQDGTSSWEPMGGDIVGSQKDSSDGRSVSLNAIGSILAVGGPHYDLDGEKDNGRVRVFQYNLQAKSWVLMGNEIIGNSGSLFGFAVDLSEDGNRVAIGARWDDDVENKQVRNGSVNIFEYDDSSQTWVQVGDQILGSQSLEQLGASVRISPKGQIVAAGALGSRPADFLPWVGGNFVTVYEFDESESKWLPMGNSIIGEAGSRSGESIALSETAVFGDDGRRRVRLAVGAALASNKDGVESGNVRLLEFQ